MIQMVLRTLHKCYFPLKPFFLFVNATHTGRSSGIQLKKKVLVSSLKMNQILAPTLAAVDIIS